MAENLSYLGLPGHLVTITSQPENQFIIDNFYYANNNPWPMWACGSA